MNDLSQKSSEELAQELQNLMPKLKSLGSGWRSFLFLEGAPTAEILLYVANIVLAQQKKIEQLKAELKELKK